MTPNLPLSHDALFDRVLALSVTACLLGILAAAAVLGNGGLTSTIAAGIDAQNPDDEWAAVVRTIRDQEGWWFLSSDGARAWIVRKQIVLEVEIGISRSQTEMGSSPESAKCHLELLFSNVERCVDLDQAVRDDMLERIKASLDQARCLEIKWAEKRAQAEESRGCWIERK